MVTRAVFLDRDGIINANLERDGHPVAPTSLEEFCILSGVEDAIRRLKDAGFLTIVVTNQPDVGTGKTDKEIIEEMHLRIRTQLSIDDIKVCYHIDSDDCVCRKPKPGMLFEAAQDWGIDLAASYLVGDRWRDVEAGRRAGCLTIFVDYGYVQDGPNLPDVIVHSLEEAAAYILD